MSSVKKICICAFCVALCCVLPTAFHSVGLGSVFSPMHIPVFLCGLICGWPYGALCGVVGPILSSLTTGMPGAVMLIYMIPELCAYGLVCGLLAERVHTGRAYGDLYLALIPAMAAGRVVGGVARALFYLASAQTWSVALWASAYVVEALPAIVLHLAVVPALVFALTKANLIPAKA